MRLRLFGILIAIVLIASCASAPEPEPPPLAEVEPELPSGPSPAALFLRGLDAWDDPDRGIRDLTRSIELDPEFALAYFERARTFRKVGRLEDALDDYSRAIEFDPALIPAYLERAEIRLWELGDESGAEDFETAYLIDPTDVRAGLSYASHLEWKDPDESLRIHDDLSEIHRDNAEVFASRARLLRGQFGDFVGALEDFRAAIRISPGDEYYRAEVVMTLLAVGRFDQAREEVQTAVAENPDSPEVALLRARLAALQENVQEAGDAYAQYMGYEWADQRVWIEAAFVAAAAGRPGVAAEALARYGEAKGENVEFRLAEIGTLALAGELVRAEEALISLADEAGWYTPVWVMMSSIAPQYAVDGRSAREIAEEQIATFEPVPRAFFPFNIDVWVWTRMYQAVNPTAGAPLDLP